MDSPPASSFQGSSQPNHQHQQKPVVARKNPRRKWKRLDLNTLEFDGRLGSKIDCKTPISGAHQASLDNTGEAIETQIEGGDTAENQRVANDITSLVDRGVPAATNFRVLDNEVARFTNGFLDIGSEIGGIEIQIQHPVPRPIADASIEEGPLNNNFSENHSHPDNCQAKMESSNTTMSYPEATNYLKLCFETSNLDTKTSIPIDLQICDAHGAIAEERVQFKCSLTGQSDLVAIVMMAQVEVDIVGDKIYDNNNKGPDEEKTKLLLNGIEIETNDSMAGMPLIAGELVSAKENGTVAAFIRWDNRDGEIQNYFEMYKRWLLKSVDTSRRPPLFKITTVRRHGPNNAIFSLGGHHFLREVEAAPTIAEGSIRRTTAGPSVPRKKKSPTNETSTGKTMAKAPVMSKTTDNEPDISASELELARRIQNEIKKTGEKPSYSKMMEIKSDMKNEGMAPTPELCLQPNVKKPGEQPKSFGTYQKMGGHPQSHALVNLENSSFSDAFTYQYTAPGEPAYRENKESGKEGDVSDMRGGNFPMVPYVDFAAENAMREEEARKILRILFNPRREREEAAKGFDKSDDATFLKGESTEVNDTEAIKLAGTAVADAQVVTQTGPANQLNALNSEMYGQPTSSSAFNSGHINIILGHNNLGFGGTNQSYSQAHAPAQPTSFLTLRSSFRTPGGEAGFNPTAAPWNSSSGGPSGSRGFYNTCPAPNPIFNPVVPNFESQLGGNQPNPFQNQSLGLEYGQNPVPSVQQNTLVTPQSFMQPFAQGGQTLFQATGTNQGTSITSPFGHRDNSPFTLRHPVRFQGNVGSAGPSNAGRSTQSTPLWESTSAEHEDPHAPTAVEAQYGTSMRLHNAAARKPNLSSVLRAESQSFQVDTPQGSTTGEGQVGRGGSSHRGSRFFGNDGRGSSSHVGRVNAPVTDTDAAFDADPNEATTAPTFGGPASQG